MEQSLLQKVKEQLLRHEGLRLKPYRCTAGKLTIGVGRNLDGVFLAYREDDGFTDLSADGVIHSVFHEGTAESDISITRVETLFKVFLFKISNRVFTLGVGLHIGITLI